MKLGLFYMDLPFQCLQPSFSGLCFLSFPFEGIYFVFWSRKELLINSSTSTLVGVFHLPILVIALSFLLENFKRNVNPQLLMSSKSWIVTWGLQAFAHFSASENLIPSIWNLSVYLEPASSKRYYFAQWTLEHFIRTKSTAWREIESMRVDAVILSSDVCCQKTYACWSREHGSQ